MYMMCLYVSPQALTCLVSYCGCYSGQVISSAIDQIHNLIDWKVCVVTNLILVIRQLYMYIPIPIAMYPT